MQPESVGDAAWSALLSRLPASLDLAASARECRALLRRRGIPDAETLLRVALSYGGCGLSLRGTAAWAETASVASLSDVAVLNRLRGSAPWLARIVGAILSARVAGPREAGFRLRVVDATTLAAPGSAGVDWRLHVTYDVGAQQTTAVELSDGRGAESLSRFAWERGDLVLGDRGYAKANDLAAVGNAGADYIVRIGWNALKLRTRDGLPFDLFAALDRLPEQGVAEAEISIALDRAGTKHAPARLVMLRKTETDAEASRRKARRKSRRQGKTVNANTLKAAGFVLLLTSLDAHRAAAADVLALYRVRWQIELVFKRLKSLLDLAALPARDPDLARSWIYAKLIVALLLENVSHDALDSPPSAEPIPTADDLRMAPASPPA
jgi:Transposase DDE domain